MQFGAVTVGAVAPVMVWIISWGNTVQALFAQIAICFFLSFYCGKNKHLQSQHVLLRLFSFHSHLIQLLVSKGPFCTWLVERFPPKIRLTSASLGFNLGICISAGFSPALATALVKTSVVAPGFIFPAFSVLGLVGLLVSTKIHQDGGIDADDSEGQGNEDAPVDIEKDLSAPLL